MRKFWKSPALKGCLVLALCLGILLALPSAEAHPRYIHPSDMPGYDEKFMLNQSTAVEQGNKMHALFGNTPTTGDENWRTPDYYAGCYINDKGNLVVLITRDVALVRPGGKGKVMATELLREVTGNPKLEIREGYKYSLTELKQMRNEVRASIQARLELARELRITGLSIDEMANRIIVYLEEVTPETIEGFRSQMIKSDFIANSGVLHCEEMAYNVPQAAVTGGAEIYSPVA